MCDLCLTASNELKPQSVFVHTNGEICKSKASDDGTDLLLGAACVVPARRAGAAMGRAMIQHTEAIHR